MTETAGGYIDFFADRGIDESELESKLAIIKEYNEKHGTHIKYCNTEYLPFMHFTKKPVFSCNS